MRLNKTNCLEPGTAMRHRSILRAVMPVLLCLLSFGISVQAASVTAGGITAMFPDSYTVLTADNLEQHADYLKRANKTPEQLRPVFEAEGCLFIALPPGGEFEISLSSMTDPSSQGIGNLIDLSYEEQERVKALLLSDALAQGKEIRSIERAGALFFRVADPSEEVSLDAAPAGAGLGGNEKGIYYVTVLNGSYVTLSLSDPSGKLASGVVEQFEYVFSNLGYTVTGMSLDSQNSKLTVLKVVLIVLCAAGVATVVWLIFTLAGEYHRRKRETAWQRKRRPKPRR